MSQARRRATAGALAFLTAAAAWGCGSSQTPEAPPPESAETAQAPAPPANRPPVVRSVAIQPWEPVAGQLLTAVADATDPDGDPVRLTYHWAIDGRRYESGESPTLLLPERSKGALVELQVVANDGQVDGLDGLDGAASHARVRVENRPPSLLDLLLEPGLEITVEDELAASARPLDPDRDPVEVRYRWFVNGRAIDVTESTLTRRHFRRGDSIQLEAVASDGDDESEPLLSPEIHVLNSPPRIVSDGHEARLAVRKAQLGALGRPGGHARGGDRGRRPRRRQGQPDLRDPGGIRGARANARGAAALSRGPRPWKRGYLAGAAAG